MKTAKRKGTRAEHKAIALLEAAGYRCTRAAGSLGVWDVIAIRADGVRLIQVKAGARCHLAPADRALLLDAPAPAGVTRELWRFFDRRPDPAIELLTP